MRSASGNDPKRTNVALKVFVYNQWRQTLKRGEEGEGSSNVINALGQEKIELYESKNGVAR